MFVKKYKALEQKACNVISKMSNGNCFKIKSNYSDNASFLANGIPAICITMLPFDELQKYLFLKKIPNTWKMLHTMEDNINNLTINSNIICFQLLTEILNV